MIDGVFSPAEIKILLHYWVHPCDYDGGDMNKGFIRNVINRLIDLRLLEEACPTLENPMKYRRGPALQTYINAICSVPAPVQVWQIPKE